MKYDELFVYMYVIHLLVISVRNYLVSYPFTWQAAMESDLPCRIYLTRVLADFDCDTFLPKIDLTTFKKINE